MQMLRRAFDVAASDRISLVAAGCAFYAMLALFPSLSLFISIAGLVLDPGSVEPQLALLRNLVPQTTHDLISARIRELVYSPRGDLGWGAAISGAIAFWSASAGIRAMLGALNLAQNEPEERGFLSFYSTALLFTMGAILAVLVGLVALVVLPLLLTSFGLPPMERALVRLVGLVVLCGVVLLAVGSLYRFGPARPPPNWRMVSSGSLSATFLWLIGSALFSFYAGHSDAYGSMYGSLGAAVALLMWLYVSAYVVLLGAEIDGAIAAAARNRVVAES